jgi:hypothetical protein
MPPQRGIPIPSFSIATVTPIMAQEESSPPPAAGAATSMSMSSESNKSAVVEANWKVSLLLQLEVSLQHWFRNKNNNNNNNKQNRNKSTSDGTTTLGMTLPEFFALVRKLDWSSRHDNNIDKDNNKCPPTIHPHDALIVHLSFEERLLHDLLCVAANPSLQNPLYTVDLEAGILTPQPCCSVETLKRLLVTTKTFDSLWSGKLCTMIMTSRTREEEKKKHQQGTTTSGTTNKAAQQQPIIIQPIITQGMTVDQRVHARAKAKQEQLRLQEEGEQPHNQETNNNLHNNNDRQWTILLADALWTHARSILARQNSSIPNKLASNSLLMHHHTTTNQQKRPSKSTKCVITFKDVVATISKSHVGEASSVQIAKALAELETFSPKFVVIIKGGPEISQHKNKSKNNNKLFKWHPTTTIYVAPDNYPAVRSQLTGIPMPTTTTQHSKKIMVATDNNMKLQSKTAASISATEPPSITTTNATPPDSSAAAPAAIVTTNTSRKRSSPVQAKNLLGDFEHSVTTSTTTEAVAEATGNKAAKQTKKETHLPNVLTKPHPSLSSLCRSAEATAQFKVSSSSTTTFESTIAGLTKKRERDTETNSWNIPAELPSPLNAAAATTTTTSPPGSPKRKRKKRNELRINHELIFYDADYGGGEVLDTTPGRPYSSSSPRPMQGLFHKMCNGERI